MELVHLNSENFKSTLDAEDGLVVVDFFATWCGPCRMLGPVMEEVQDEVGDRAKIYKLDIDEGEDVARSYGIMSVPSVLFFKNGEEIGRFVGFKNKAQVIEEIERYLS